jgi:hypothetical protein
LLYWLHCHYHHRLQLQLRGSPLAVTVAFHAVSMWTVLVFSQFRKSTF